MFSCSTLLGFGCFPCLVACLRISFGLLVCLLACLGCLLVCLIACLFVCLLASLNMYSCYVASLRVCLFSLLAYLIACLFAYLLMWLFVSHLARPLQCINVRCLFSIDGGAVTTKARARNCMLAQQNCFDLGLIPRAVRSLQVTSLSGW